MIYYYYQILNIFLTYKKHSHKHYFILLILNLNKDKYNILSGKTLYNGGKFIQKTQKLLGKFLNHSKTHFNIVWIVRESGIASF